MLHVPYSSELSPGGFSLFLRLKRAIKGHRNVNIRTVTQELCNIPKSVAQYCFKDIKKRINDANRTYFEGDSEHQTGSLPSVSEISDKKLY